MSIMDALKTFPVIETDRLILREILPEDEENLYKIFSDEETMQYYGLETYKQPEDARNTIRHMRKGFKNRWTVKWAVTMKDRGQFIGLCGFHNWVKSDRRSEIGYILDKNLWGKGIMAEALTSIIQYGFSRLELNRVEAVVHVENTRSLRLLERLNFRNEGLMRQYKYYNGRFHDFSVLALLKDES